MTKPLTLRSDDPMAVELMTALEQGEVERLRQLLAADPGLARCVVESAKGGGRTALHLFADWPGHKPNAVAIVRTLVEAGQISMRQLLACGTGRHRCIGLLVTTMWH
jgi:hypothetical protein